MKIFAMFSSVFVYIEPIIRYLVSKEGREVLQRALEAVEHAENLGQVGKDFTALKAVETYMESKGYEIEGKRSMVIAVIEIALQRYKAGLPMKLRLKRAIGAERKDLG